MCNVGTTLFYSTSGASWNFFLSFSLDGFEKHPRFFLAHKKSKAVCVSVCVSVQTVNSAASDRRRSDLPLLFWECADCMTHTLMYLSVSAPASQPASLLQVAEVDGQGDVHSVAKRGPRGTSHPAGVPVRPPPHTPPHPTPAPPFSLLLFVLLSFSPLSLFISASHVSVQT